MLNLTARNVTTRNAVRSILALMLAALVLLACGKDERSENTRPQFAATAQATSNECAFAIHPLHNPVRLFEIYGPLIEYPNRSIQGTLFRLEAARNYEEFENKLYARQFDFALPNS